MRQILALLVTIALPAVAAAQSRLPPRAEFPALAPIGVGLPSILSPLTPIGLPLAPLGIRPDSGKRSLGVRQSSQRPVSSRFHGRRDVIQPPAVVFFVPYPMSFAPYPMDIFAPAQYSMPGYVASPPPPPPAPPLVARTTGVLYLELKGADRGAQVFVDGYFVGTLEDLSSQLLLETGPHQIEVRANAHETLVFDVQIVTDRAITYKADLTPIGSAPATSSPPATIYFIPGCYLGNVPPSRASLPATCDISQLTTYKP
jgi:hypothetical protein